MTEKVVIIDYQLGNLFSVKQACGYLGYAAHVTSDPDVLQDADYAILPGVGAFGDAMKNLKSLGLVDGIYSFVKQGKPLMGVCLGLQLLLSESEEFGTTKGLNLIPGIVKKFDLERSGDTSLKVPQIQWNQIKKQEHMDWDNTPLQTCKSGDFMYFVHSFYVKPEDQCHVLSYTTYGNNTYCSSVLKDNVFATQFHPEKSGLYGVNIYKQWFNLYRK